MANPNARSENPARGPRKEVRSLLELIGLIVVIWFVVTVVIPNL